MAALVHRSPRLDPRDTPLTASARRWRRAPYLCAALLLSLQIGTVLRLNDGRLTYTLDDAYIHLAVSESLAQGHYGIHPSEASAPASSILWPFLLVLGAPFAWHGILPLGLNLAGLAATLALLASTLRCGGLHRVAQGEAFCAGLLMVCLVTLNGTGLVLTGMEHSLQVALAMAVVLGMLVVDRGAPPPVLMSAAIVIGPLVRYESAAVSVAACLLLAVRGHRRTALLTGSCSLLLLVAFSAFLLRQGLEPLPAPVMDTFAAKEPSGSSLVLLVKQRLQAIVVVMPAGVLAVFAGALLAAALVSRRDRTLALCGALVPVLHLAFGSCRGFARYEIYAVTSVVALLLHSLRRPLRRLVVARGAALTLLAVAAVLLPAFAGYAATAWRSPLAAHNIYQQHEQMHRFVTRHYRRPVAVNDVGRVSFQNPRYVLDLWGLTSAEVRRARRLRRADWPAVFVERHGIELAMLYDAWFRDRIPASWRRVAVLRLRGKRITPSASQVSFFLTRPGPAAELVVELQRFRETLPADAALDIEPPFNTRPRTAAAADPASPSAR